MLLWQFQYNKLVLLVGREAARTETDFFLRICGDLHNDPLQWHFITEVKIYLTKISVNIVEKANANSSYAAHRRIKLPSMTRGNFCK